MTTTTHPIQFGQQTVHCTPEQFDLVAETLNAIPTAIVTPAGQVTFGRTALIMAKLAEAINNQNESSK